MGFLIEAGCSNCKYQAGRFIVGDGLHLIFTCDNCKSVVNPQRIPFRYTLPVCPDCNARLHRANWIDVLNLVVSCQEPIESTYPCPRCEQGRLSFQEVVHFNYREIDDRSLQIGAMVHGRITKSKELEIPWPFRIHDEAYLEDGAIRTSNKIMELRTTRMEQNATEQKTFFFEFVRYLANDDLENEPVEQPPIDSKVRGILKKTGLITAGM